VASISKVVQHPKEGRNLLDEHQAILTILQHTLAQIKGESAIKLPSLKIRPGASESREQNMQYLGQRSH
jgi:hypothetical protein